MKTQIRGKRGLGQSILEYAILLAIVSAAFLAMSLYVRRAVQGQIYTMEGLTTARSNQTFNPFVIFPGW